MRIQDPDTEMYAPVNLAVMEPLNIKSLCRRLALKRDRCELEFRVRAFMSSRRDRLYRTFMVNLLVHIYLHIFFQERLGRYESFDFFF